MGSLFNGTRTMEPRITINKDYVLVEPQEREFWTVLQSFERLFEMPEYQKKNTIWLFHEGPLQITFDDLYKIKNFIIEHSPDNKNNLRKLR